MANSVTKTDWSMNTDIYDIVDSIETLKKNYIEDEDETTLSLGVFGFITDTEAKKIQTSSIMTGQLGNEMFPTRAILTKNVLTHAAYHGLTDFNATPATINITLCIKLTDIAANIDEDGYFYIDHKCPIFISNYEFHFDYDVRIKRKLLKTGSYSYSAMYVLPSDTNTVIENHLSDLTNPYLNQPFLINIGSYEYLGIQAKIRQCSIEETTDTMVSDSIIENKSYSFSFENQMASFSVQVTTDGVTTELTPYMYGSVPNNTDDYYCWYLYTGTNDIRITFDSRSYVPGLNSQIYIKAYTTLGDEGNFEYLNVDRTSDGVYTTIESTTYEYKAITVYMVAISDSENGTDAKTKEQLQLMIPKAAMARGSITTETDMNNYFNYINNELNRLVMVKKVDNQLNRVWFSYFLLKDDLGNIIPSNCFDLKLIINDGSMFKCYDGRYILPANSKIKLDPVTNIGTVISETDIPAAYTDKFYDNGYYYYTTIYNIVLDTDPLYSSYYLTTCNYDSFFTYTYVNENNDTQFIANRFHFVRNLVSEEDQYRMTFNIAKSINDNTFEAIETETIEYTDEEGNTKTKEVETKYIVVVLVLYKDGVAYRWMECTLTAADEIDQVYTFCATMVSDNTFDNDNCIKILGMNRAGSTKSTYGFVDENTEANIYILSKQEVDSTEDYPRKDLDNIAPGYEDYIVTNIYKCTNGLDFFKNHTNIINCKITPDLITNTVYTISNVPCIGAHYIRTDDEGKYVIEAIDEKKAYIDQCLELVENSITVDFKFFNTYGPSRTYTLEDTETFIGHIDIDLDFKLSIKANVDISIVSDIKAYIKTYIEDINDIGDFHAPNLVRDVINEYSDSINFIEFTSFNLYDEDDQHIIKVDTGDPNVIPEFINVRNYIDVETNTLVPSINITLV